MDKLTYFCPQCWYSQKQPFEICPQCKSDQKSFKQDTLDQKLIGALTHPVEETRLMAIWLIGQRRMTSAWSLLEERLKEMTMSFYESREILQTMRLINPQKTIPIASAVAHSHPSEMVRRVARHILKNLHMKEHHE